MTRNHYVPGKVNPHLPHDGVELEGPPPGDATDFETAQRNADLLVSQLMLGSTKPGSHTAPRKALPKATPNPRLTASERATDAPVVPPVPDAPAKPEAQPMTQVNTQPKAETPKARTTPVEFRNESDVTDQLRQAFPQLKKEEKPSILRRVPLVYPVGAACALIVLVWPTLLFWALITACVLLLAFSGLMKIPGVAKTLSEGWSIYARRNPRRAVRIGKMADRVAMALESVLDLLPGSLADRLALPDFSQSVPSKR